MWLIFFVGFYFSKEELYIQIEILILQFIYLLTAIL